MSDVLGEIFGDNEEETVKKVKIRNLPPVGLQIPIDGFNKPVALEFIKGAPRSRFTTPWFLAKAGYCRVTLTIVGPKAKHPENELPLSRRKAEDELQAITDLIEAFKQEILGKDTIIP